MATARFLPTLRVGFIQINGETFPTITSDQKQSYVFEYNGQLAMVTDASFYEMSKYEFYKWFPFPSIEDHLKLKWYEGTLMEASTYSQRMTL